MAQDILIDDDFELAFFGGDFKVGNSDQTHVELLIQTHVGHWKKSPLVGVGIDFFLNSNVHPGHLERLIRMQLVADGFRVKSVTVVPDAASHYKVYIDAERIQD